MAGITATLTNAGLNLLASALQNAGANAALSYVALGTGAGQLAAPLTPGVAITSLPVNALPAGLPVGSQLSLISQTNSDMVTLSAPANPGDVSVSIQSWTPGFAYPAGSGLVSTPTALDTALQAEVVRKATGAGSAGGAPGESLHSAYFGTTDSPGVTFLEAGFYGGPGASSAAGSGVLIARGLLWWQHTSGDTSLVQLDSII